MQVKIMKQLILNKNNLKNFELRKTNKIKYSRLKLIKQKVNNNFFRNINKS